MENTWIDKAEYPFTSKYFDCNGYKMHYIEEGTGPTILFVHGTPSWSFEFRNVIKKLSGSSRCIAIDLIGFGLSDKPKKYDYSLEQHASNVEDFIASLGLHEISLVVHDFGGPVALRYAAKFPEDIKEIIVINSWMWSSEREPGFQKIQKMLNSPIIHFLYLNLNFSARFLMPRTFVRRPPKPIMRHYTKPFSRKDERYGVLGFLKSLANNQEWFNDLWKQKQRLFKIPALIIWGKDDPVLKYTDTEKYNEVFDDLRLELIENCGHFPSEEMPEATGSHILKFIQRKR